MTTETVAPERLTYTFDAAWLARGWLSTELAASRDAERLALYEAICIEVYETGFLLLATDGHVMLRSWVPTRDALEAAGSDTVPRPSIDEAPLRTVVALDPSTRARGLLAYVHKVATAKDAPPMTLTCSIGPSELDEGAVAFDGMEAVRVGIEFGGAERIELPTFDGAWPTWRRYLNQWTPAETASVALNPEILGRLVKLGALHGNLPLIWGFGGPEKPATVEVRHAMPSVDGVVMPIRLSADELERAETPA